MHTQSDEALRDFNIGDLVREIGKPQVLTIIECRAGVPHIYIEAVKTVYYKCEWHQSGGKIYSKWYNANNLEKFR